MAADIRHAQVDLARRSGSSPVVPGARRTEWRSLAGVPVARAILGTIGVLAIGGCRGDSQGLEFAVTPEQAVLLVLETLQFTAVSAPGTVFWESSDPEVVTVVAETGFVTAVGRGTATIRAVSEGREATASVTSELQPNIQLSAPTVEFNVLIAGGDPAPRTIGVSNGGDRPLTGLAVGVIDYGPGQPVGWLLASLGGSVAPTTLQLSASVSGLARGEYTATVPVTSDGATNSPQHVAVALRIQAPPVIEVSPSNVALAATPDKVVSRTVDVTNGGDLPLTGLGTSISYTAGPVTGWLSAALGSASAPTVLTITANTTALAATTYRADVTVTSTVAGVAPKVIPVELMVSPGPLIFLSQGAVTFNAVQGSVSPPSQTVTITNAGGDVLTGLATGSVTYSGGASGWLSGVLAGTTAPTSLVLSVSSSTLAAGSYSAVVPILSPVAGNSPQNLTVNLDVDPPPVLTVSPSSVLFSSWANATIQPNAQPVSVTNTGGGTISGLSASISYGVGAGWLTATFQGGNTTANTVLLLQPSAAGLARGTYTATVTVSAPSVASKTVTVSFNVSGFTLDIHNVLFTPLACASCHMAQGPIYSANATTYRNNLVAGGHVPTNGNDAITLPASLLLCRLTSTCSGHTGPSFPTGAINTLRSWIRAGAPAG